MDACVYGWMDGWMDKEQGLIEGFIKKRDGCMNGWSR